MDWACLTKNWVLTLASCTGYDCPWRHACIPHRDTPDNGSKAWYCCPSPMAVDETLSIISDSTLHYVDSLSEPSLLFTLKMDTGTGDAIGEARVPP
jgi:hypothetical protein